MTPDELDQMLATLRDDEAAMAHTLSDPSRGEYVADLLTRLRDQVDPGLDAGLLTPAETKVLLALAAIGYRHAMWRMVEPD